MFFFTSKNFFFGHSCLPNLKRSRRRCRLVIPILTLFFFFSFLVFIDRTQIVLYYAEWFFLNPRWSFYNILMTTQVVLRFFSVFTSSILFIDRQVYCPKHIIILRLWSIYQNVIPLSFRCELKFSNSILWMFFFVAVSSYVLLA